MPCEQEKIKYLDEAEAYGLTLEELSVEKQHVLFAKAEIARHTKEVVECIRKINKKEELRKMIGCLDKDKAKIGKARKDLKNALAKVVGLENGLRSLRISKSELFHVYWECKKNSIGP